ANFIKLEDGLQIKLIYKVETSSDEQMALKNKIMSFINSQGVSSFSVCSSFTDSEKTEQFQKQKDDSWKKVESILKKTAQTPTIGRVAIYIDKDNNLKLNDQPVSQENLLKEINRLNTFLTPEQRRKHVWVSVLYE